MIKKAKFSGHARQFFSKVLGSKRTKAIIGLYYTRKFRKQLFSFPINPDNVKTVLIVLPEDSLEILYQLKNLLSLLAIFNKSVVTLFCLESKTSLLKMIPDLNVVEYAKSDIDTYSATLGYYQRMFKNKVDVCILLDRNPCISIISLVVSTNASIRAGYKDAGEFPFLNLKVSSAEKQNYLPEKNCVMAEMFGKGVESLRFSVSKQHIDEIDHMLKEQRISNDHGLIGLDALVFLKKYGEQWLIKLIAQIKKDFSCQIYCYLSHEPSSQEATFFKSENLPCITELPESRVAALVSKSDLVISSNSIFYGIAAMIGKRAVGLFTSDEFTTYCPDTSKIQGIVWNGKSDDQCLIELCAHIRKLLEKTKFMVKTSNH